jgi:hypothetical protein
MRGETKWGVCLVGMATEGSLRDSSGRAGGEGAIRFHDITRLQLNFSLSLICFYDCE